MIFKLKEKEGVPCNRLIMTASKEFTAFCPCFDTLNNLFAGFSKWPSDLRALSVRTDNLGLAQNFL